MKLLAILTIGLMAFVAQAQATEQSPDVVIHDGVIYKLHERPNGKFPMEILWADRESRPNLSQGPHGMMSTACWRGYIAIWEIEGGVLYLKGLDAWQGDQKADLKALFPERFQDGKVKADWFTGTLALSEGFRLEKEPSITLKFEAGEMIPNNEIDSDKQ
jgi:hypothetical protein